MPTFFILYKIHHWRRRLFFPIVFKLYKQMLIDLLTLIPRLITFILFPRASMTFYIKNIFRYTKFGIDQFDYLESVKFDFIIGKILFDGLTLYFLIGKILFVKIFWVRKRDMNQSLKNKKIKISAFIKDFLTTVQTIPNVKELTKIYSGFKSEELKQEVSK